MALSRKKKQIDGRLEVLRNCDRGTLESVLPLFLSFVWNVEQYMRVEGSFLSSEYRDFKRYFAEKDARRNVVISELKQFYKMFGDANLK